MDRYAYDAITSETMTLTQAEYKLGISQENVYLYFQYAFHCMTMYYMN